MNNTTTPTLISKPLGKDSIIVKLVLPNESQPESLQESFKSKSDEPITEKQNLFLTNLIKSRYSADPEMRNHLLSELPTLTKREAGNAIKKLIGKQNAFQARESEDTRDKEPKPITPKQRALLLKLMESKYLDEEIRQYHYKRIENFTTKEANLEIKKMIGKS